MKEINIECELRGYRENVWRAKIYQIGTQFATVLEGTMIKCELWGYRETFYRAKIFLHEHNSRLCYIMSIIQ